MVRARWAGGPGGGRGQPRAEPRSRSVPPPPPPGRARLRTAGSGAPGPRREELRRRSPERQEKQRRWDREGAGRRAHRAGGVHAAARSGGCRSGGCAEGVRAHRANYLDHVTWPPTGARPSDSARRDVSIVAPPRAWRCPRCWRPRPEVAHGRKGDASLRPQDGAEALNPMCSF